ncbi:MAG: hypothetical protein NVS2B4_06030 [Ramlibacter sp.]
MHSLPARIIGLLSLTVALAGCSAFKLGYESLAQAGYWWLDGYVDFDQSQGRAVRQDLTRLHAWHRAHELPRYAQLLRQLEDLARADITPAQACALEPQLRARVEALRDQIEPMLAAQSLTLQPGQLEHLERKYEQRNREYDKDWARLAPGSLLDKRVQEIVGRAEIVYGELDDPQRALLRQELRHSPYSPALVSAERRRRQQEALAVFRRLSGPGVTITDARAAIRALLDRLLVSPDPTYATHVAAMRQETCHIAAVLHNSMRPSQREHAVQRLRGWQQNLGELARPS